MAQRLGREDERVVVELAQVLGRHLLERHRRAALGEREADVVRAIGVRGEIAAAVRRAELETGEAIERAFVDEMRERERRLERIPDGVLEPAVAAQAVCEIRRALRVHENEHAELLGLGPERMELRLRQFLALDRATDRRAAQPELLHRLLELLRSEIRVLERDARKGHQAVAMLRAELGEPLVLQLDDLGRQVALEAVPGRIDAERLQIDALRIQALQAFLPRDGVDARALVLHQRFRLGDDAVRVHVDRLDAPAGDAHLAPAHLRMRLGHERAADEKEELAAAGHAPVRRFSSASVLKNASWSRCAFSACRPSSSSRTRSMLAACTIRRTSPRVTATY